MSHSLDNMKPLNADSNSIYRLMRTPIDAKKLGVPVLTWDQIQQQGLPED